MRKLILKALLLVAVVAPSIAQAAPTPAQRCDADVELASAKFAQCRLTAEAKYSKSLDVDKRSAALARCSEKLQQSFAKAVVRYGLNCTNVPVAEFDAYLKQCSDDAAAAAAGTALPDYVGDLASCNADLAAVEDDLTTCAGDLMTCSANLAACEATLTTTSADLATCEGGLAVCEALPPARLLKTGQTTGYGAGSDGDSQLGISQNFIDNADGTITDTKTGLMWEKKSDDGTIHDKDDTYTWSMGAPWNNTGTAFTTFLATLNDGAGFAGYTDWRLPNRKELESLTNLQTFGPAVFPAFNTGCIAPCTVLTCSCTASAYYWSSSTYVNFQQTAWYVDFAAGFVFDGTKTNFNYVRAVRSGS